MSEALAGPDLPFTVGFTFLAEGIRVGGAWRPVVKMEWVEGLLLNQVVRENAGRPAVLAALAQMWVKLCKRLREAGHRPRRPPARQRAAGAGVAARERTG